MTKEMTILPDAYEKGFDGTNPDDVQSFTLSNFEEDFTHQYDTDAHFTCYTVPELAADGRAMRINKEALQPLIDAGTEPQLQWVAIDVDNPGHREWTEEDHETFEALYMSTDLLACATIYFTKHGWRALWPLEVPLPVRYADDFLQKFHDHCRSLGIDVDTQCSDWTRLYRMPNVLRDSQPYTSPDILTETMTTLPWAASDLVDATAAAPATTPTDYDGDLDDHWVVSALDHIDPDCAYGEWYRVGIALKTEFGDAGFELWDTWSSKGGKYEGRQKTLDKWNTFKDTYYGKRVTLGTIRHYAVESGYEPPAATECYEELAELFGITTEQAKKRAMVFSTTSKFAYVYEESLGYYTPAYAGDSIVWALENLCPTLASGRHLNPKGEPLAYRSICAELGSPAEQVKLVLGQTGNHYDAKTRTMHEGAGGVDPNIYPQFDPEIDQWLELLGGKDADKLKDWLAGYLEFSKPMCALYIHGPNSVGKGLLAEGISKGLHNQVATPYSALTGDFQGELTQCPLILADEAIPSGFFDDKSSAVFRRIIGTSEMPINRKYQPVAMMSGAPRLLVTANNDDALKMREDMTEEDIEAVKLRIGYIHTDDAAAKYLASLGGRAYTEKWVAGKGLARHIMWLHQNRVVQQGTRFYVQGWMSDLVENFAYKISINEELLMALVNYLVEGSRHDYMPYGGGQLLVHTKTIHRKWTEMTEQAHAPSQRKISRALQSISFEDTVRPLIAGKRPVCYSINPKALLHAAKEHNICDPEDIIDALGIEVIEDELNSFNTSH